MPALPRPASLGPSAALLAALLASGPLAPPVAAQAASSITGIVVHDLTLQPVAGAAIHVLNADRRARSDEDGFFTVDVLPGTLTLKVVAEGYVSLVEEVEVGVGESTLVQFHLPRLDAALTELRVGVGRARGLPETGEPFGGTRSQAADRSALDLLSHGVPGVWITRGDGGAGGGLRIVVRGISSVAMSNEPQIYVNGVRVSNNDVLENIPARDVERIRVLHGASAGPRYAESADGIILIETRKGPGDPPR